MKVVIAGSRPIAHEVKYHMERLEKAAARFEAEHGKITLVISGRARGPDRLGEMWAADRKIPVAGFAANWDLNGKAAGPIRNLEMGKLADAGIILWDGVSVGTRHMMKVLKTQNKPFILDTFDPVVYNSYQHQANGAITISTLDQFMTSDGDAAYDF